MPFALVLRCLQRFHSLAETSSVIFRKRVFAHPSSFAAQRRRDPSKKMQLTLEFGGGLELLCDSVKIHNVNVETPKGAQQLAMRDLLVWVQKNLIKERPEMFIKGDTVRPGVLVLVNDCDWELSGQLDTTLEEKDVVVFISTLHGG
ncbi:ubiquitin-related modifier 1 homolog 2 [Eucalyptus grandis]|uniref:ubiquitin-related modifier 1 homolog 2 n=1 Tax=Eucalyptus grandis TaxID=71139 RepID=UPI00192E88C3|nr:ubiquitin-related modifier 1 homolog 2 [Eucalyptus grandis]